MTGANKPELIDGMHKIRCELLKALESDDIAKLKAISGASIELIDDLLHKIDPNYFKNANA